MSAATRPLRSRSVTSGTAGTPPPPTRALAGRVPATIRLSSQRGRGLPSTVSVLREGREPVKWTQNQIADSAGVSVSTVSHLFRGERRGYHDTLKLIASVLDVTIEELSTFLVSRRTNRSRRAAR